MFVQIFFMGDTCVDSAMDVGIAFQRKRPNPRPTPSGPSGTVRMTDFSADRSSGQECAFLSRACPHV